MLIGNVFEKTTAESAWQLSADKLADWVRNQWQENRLQGRWESASHEDYAALPGLRLEGFKGLVGLDYVFKWWGAEDSDGLAGEVDVIWKVLHDESEPVTCYCTLIKLAERDFILGLYTDETEKRGANRLEFRKAFEQWKELFSQL